MWPWGHLALAYLAYTALVRIEHSRDESGNTGPAPTGPGVIAVGFGSQAPDLIDKPLAWTMDVLPTGRSLGHSLLVVGPLVLVAYAVARRRDTDRTAVVAFAVGALSHLFGDALYPLVERELAEVGFLAWPVVPPHDYEVKQSFAAHFALVEPSPELAFEFLLVGLAVAVWYRDGTPGLGTLGSWSRRLAGSVIGAHDPESGQ